MSLWGLLFLPNPPPIMSGQETKIVWRMTGQGALTIFAENADGRRVDPVWGPEEHGGSNWQRPGDEWGTGFIFPTPGCWRIVAARTVGKGEVWFEIAPYSEVF